MRAAAPGIQAFIFALNAVAEHELRDDVERDDDNSGQQAAG